MRRKITKESLIKYITRLDTRCKKFDKDKFDEIIDDAFSELNTFSGFFHDDLLSEDHPLCGVSNQIPLHFMHNLAALST